MGRYPRNARNAQMKCIECNAPVVRTADGAFACVSCGDAPISTRTSRPSADGASPTGLNPSPSDD